MATSQCPARVPNWVLSAATKPLDSTLQNASETVKARAEAFLRLFKGLTDEAVARAFAQPTEQVTEPTTDR